MNDGCILVNNRNVKVHPDLSLYYNIRKNNPVEPELYNFLDKCIKEGDVFVDIGANAGFISLLASTKVGSKGKVIAFEPNPVVSYYTHFTLANNAPYHNYILLQQALSEEFGLASFSISSQDSILMERASLVFKEGVTKDVDVLCSTLDAVLPMVLKPTMLKIDVEGAELQVLKGAIKTLEKHKPDISLELHGLYFDDPETHVEALFNFFEGLGYTAVNLLKKRTETFKEFMKDSGVPHVEYSKKGYGNLILISDKKRVDEVINLMGA
jgi:FkbM family methyltransferase